MPVIDMRGPYYVLLFSEARTDSALALKKEIIGNKNKK